MCESDINPQHHYRGKKIYPIFTVHLFLVKLTRSATSVLLCLVGGQFYWWHRPLYGFAHCLHHVARCGFYWHFNGFLQSWFEKKKYCYAPGFINDVFLTFTPNMQLLFTLINVFLSISWQTTQRVQEALSLSPNDWCRRLTQKWDNVCKETKTRT